MAISKNIELSNGIKVDGAYIRVEYPSVTKDSISFTVRKYVASDKPFFSEDFITAPYTLDGANPFVQAYEYLKSLPEYTDAVDC
jgi:hypothetical protein